MNGKNILHQLKNCTQTQMMSYVIETADDRIIVIDGGVEGDAAYLVDFIRNLTGGELRVDAWFLTHAHSDHIDAFMDIISRYGCAFIADKVYYNFPPADFIAVHESGEYHTVCEFNELLPAFAHKTQVVHIGDRIEVGAFTADILWEPDTSITGNAINNSSVVFRITLGQKTVLMLGDLGGEAGDAVLTRYGAALQSDIVEMAHHGQNGVERDFYQAVAPKACLWCTPQWLWDNDAGVGYNTHSWKTVIVRGWMDALGVTEHYIEKDGTASISLD